MVVRSAAPTALTILIWLSQIDFVYLTCNKILIKKIKVMEMGICILIFGGIFMWAYMSVASVIIKNKKR
jgi:hypothetical protein